MNNPSVGQQAHADTIRRIPHSIKIEPPEMIEESNDLDEAADVTDEGPRKMRNGDKVRLMMRLRRMIDELNDMCPEHFVVAIASPEASKHISYYGSRSMVRTMYKSSLADKLWHGHLESDDKAPIYMPVTRICPLPNESNLSESLLYSQVLRLLDLYNYPGREHYSFKNKGKKGCSPRPKPKYWPQEIRYGSLLCGHIGNLVEPYAASALMVASRRDIIIRVLCAVRSHYAHFVAQLGDHSPRTDELEEVDIEDVANFEELDGETEDVEGQDVKAGRLAPKLEVLDEDVEAGMSPAKKQLTESGGVPTMIHGQLRRRKAHYDSGSIGQVLSPQKWNQNSGGLFHQQQQLYKQLPVITEKDRVFTLNATPRIRHMPWPPQSTYQIKMPLDDGRMQLNMGQPCSSNSFPTEIANEEVIDGGGQRIVTIDGQEYTVMDEDPELDPTLMYEELDGDDASYGDIHPGGSMDTVDAGDQMLLHEPHDEGPVELDPHLDPVNIPLPHDYVLSPDNDHVPYQDMQHQSVHQRRSKVGRLYKLMYVPGAAGPVQQKYIVKVIQDGDPPASTSSSVADTRSQPAAAMYEQWPILEFPDLGSSILDLFTRSTSESVSSALLSELTRDDAQDLPAIRLNTEDQLRWCMQVLNHSLSFSFATHREYDTIHAAVRVYLHWLRALTDVPDGSIPTPLLDTPEKYFRTIIEALRSVFCRRIDKGVGDVPRGLAIERQATEIENILDSVRAITHSASRKYQNEVWARSLSFLLNSADLLLSEPSSSEEMGIRVGSRVVDTLFELWFRAVLHEEIPSPTYWRTLSVLCRRWRHHVTVIESWARKMLSMTVLVCRKMYGDDYSRILIHDDSIIPFGLLPDQDEDGEIDLLYHSWYNLMSLLDSPAGILSHDPVSNKPIHGGLERSASSVDDVSPASLPLCFFLAVTAIQRMVDVFYGDSRVPIEFKESDVLIRKWTMSAITVDEAVSGKTRIERDKASTVTDSTRDTRDTDGTLTNDGRGSFSSSISGTGKDGRTLSDLNRKTVKRQSDRSDKQGVDSASNATRTQHSRIDPSLSQHAASLPPLQGSTAPSSRVGESISTRLEPKLSMVSNEGNRPSAAHFVAHSLSVNPVYPPFVGERGPKSERLLALTMQWLLEAATARMPHDRDRQKGDVGDDVISGLSLHSVDLDDVPDAMNAVGERGYGSNEKKRRSLGSSSSSMTGEPSQATNEYSVPTDPLAVDGVSAGRAAALATLTRIVCSKSTGEKLPNQQMAAYLATLHQALIEKDRIVLCALFYYGHSLYRLGLPAIESVLPHFLFALDIVLIESSKLRLHPSIHEVEMRRCCLRCLQSVVCWPTSFGMSRIPQVAESANLKSSASTYLHLRSRIYKTLVFSLRNETDPTNLQMTLAMCSVLMEESCSFDLGLTEEQTAEMHRITTNNNGSQPEKGLCVSFVRGLVSAVCDRICRPEWAGEHSVSLAAIDLLNALSHIHPTVLFNNRDVSTGSLIVASLCRFIETQLMKPPPLHSKDLHSTVVAAYSSIAVWLCAAPMLAECESVLNTVAEAVQLGVTGSKSHESTSTESQPERKSAPASKRVLEAAEYLMYSLFCCVGRGSRWSLCDERRLLYLYGPSAIDTTRFRHFIVNGDTLLSLHEASHIVTQSDGCPCVLYVRRSPMQAACVGVARLRPHPEGYRADQVPPPTPMSATFPTDGKKESVMSQQSQASRTSGQSSLSSVSESSAVSSGSRQSTVSGQSVPSGSILSGVSAASIQSAASSQITISGSQNGTPTPSASSSSAPIPSRPQPSPIGHSFVVPPEFSKMGCKLDTMIRTLESTPETDAIQAELRRVAARPQRQAGNVWAAMPMEKRAAAPKEPAATCDSIRVLLYDMGLVDKEVFGTGIVQLDSGQSADFYRDLHDMVDSCPSRSLHTAHVFYVKEGQRSAVDILDNALNIQNTSADFCGFLGGLGEGVEVGQHDSWTGHWSTAFSNERKPLEEPEAVDHYLLDGVSHALWWADAGCELAFLMPTERSLRMFKQDLTQPAVSSRRGSSKNMSNMSASSSDDVKGESISFDSQQSDVFLQPPGRGRGGSNVGSDRDGFQPYGGGGSSMGNSPPLRRCSDLRVLLVWLERSEDMHHFPVDELLSACDDGGDRSQSARGERPAHTVIYLHQIEQGIINVRTRGSPNRFGEAGPLCDGMVVSLSSLPAFVRLTLLNINRRNVAEIENYQFTHTKRKQAIVEFGKKYAANLTYEDFLSKLIER